MARCHVDPTENLKNISSVFKSLETGFQSIHRLHWYSCLPVLVAHQHGPLGKLAPSLGKRITSNHHTTQKSSDLHVLRRAANLAFRRVHLARAELCFCWQAMSLHLTRCQVLAIEWLMMAAASQLRIVWIYVYGHRCIQIPSNNILLICSHYVCSQMITKYYIVPSIW